MWRFAQPLHRCLRWLAGRINSAADWVQAYDLRHRPARPPMDLSFLQDDPK
jgi:hypothetical protein